MCISIQKSYILPDYEIRFNYEIDEGVYLDIDKMIPLGLIFNEAITNSLKHAFPGKIGEITLSVKKVKSKIQVSISDNGVGLRKDFNLETDSHLGIQLINILTDQLGGKIKVNNAKGLKYEIEFE